MTKNRKDLAMDIIEASPLAKNIVNQAGCNIYVIPSTHREEAGEYHMDKNEIHLDPTRTNTEMALALVNKARHAARNGVQVDPACDLKTNLKSTRAQFADAVAVECAVAHELKGKHPAAWEAFSKEHPKVADSYQAAMSKTGNDQAKSMSVAFKAWYQEYDNVAACDKRTIDLLTKEMGKKHQDFLGKSVDGEQIGQHSHTKPPQSYGNRAEETGPHTPKPLFFGKARKNKARAFTGGISGKGNIC